MQRGLMKSSAINLGLPAESDFMWVCALMGVPKKPMVYLLKRTLFGGFWVHLIMKGEYPCFISFVRYPTAETVCKIVSDDTAAR